MKLKAKLNLSILSALLALFTISTLLIYNYTKTWAENSATELLKNKSQASSIQVKSFFEDAINKTYALSEVVAALKNNPKTTRPEYRSTVRRVLEKNNNYLSVWIQFEPNKMDSLDYQYKDSSDYGSRGRFQHSFYKSNKQILMQVVPKDKDEDDQYSEDYYAVPKKENGLTLVEPYSYDYVGDGKESFFETSIAIPYHNTDNTFMGVIGVDLDLSPLQLIYKDVKMFETGYCQLISNTGIVVTDHDGKAIASPNADSTNTEVMTAIKNGRDYTYISLDKESGKEFIVNYTPIYFGESKQPWSLCFRVLKSEAMAEANSILTNIIIIELISMLILGIIVYLLADSIVKPLLKSIDIAKSIALGNLSFDMGEIKGKDEISQLLNNLKEMAERLKFMIGNVSSGITQITNAGVELNDLSQKLSEGANSQASGAEESAAAIEEIAASIRETAGNAKTTEVTAQKIASEIHTGQKAVANTLTKMKEISNKINIVNELASQTNILAINAAVEAARAGEHGKGFAAIAGEVRKLAEKSNLAALEINELAVQSVNVAIESSNLLLELVPQVENTAQLIKEIANANVQQDSGINQINEVINSHNEIIQETAAMSEEMAASSKELTTQSEELRNAIAYFNVN